jgi:hypothetical protein
MLLGNNSASESGECAFAMTPDLCDTFPGTWADGGCTLDISKNRYAVANVNTLASRDLKITTGDTAEVAGPTAVAGIAAGTMTAICLPLCVAAAVGVFKFVNAKKWVKVVAPTRKDGLILVDVADRSTYSDKITDSGEA